MRAASVNGMLRNARLSSEACRMGSSCIGSDEDTPPGQPTQLQRKSAQDLDAEFDELFNALVPDGQPDVLWLPRSPRKAATADAWPRPGKPGDVDQRGRSVMFRRSLLQHQELYGNLDMESARPVDASKEAELASTITRVQARIDAVRKSVTYLANDPWETSAQGVHGTHSAAEASTVPR